MTLFSQAGSHNYASHTQPLESDLEKKMNATCGQKCLESFGRFNRNGLWAKTFSALLIGQEGWFSRRCKLTWKVKGTKYNRMYFQLRVSTLPTNEIEFGLSHTELLPTQESFDWNSARHPELWERDKKKYAEKGINLHCNLRQMARLSLLPTPRVGGQESYETRVKRQGHEKAISYLEANVEWQMSQGMLPTPTSGLEKHSDKESYWKNRKEKGRQEDLQMVVHEIAGYNSQLNPLFVGEMMGFPPNWLELPFQNTETNP